MKIKWLIEELKKLDPDLDVILSKDSEGNHYSPLSDSYGLNHYEPESTYSGEVYSCGKGKEDCIVLYPIN